jgi:hypothetical protein
VKIQFQAQIQCPFKFTTPLARKGFLAPSSSNSPVVEPIDPDTDSVPNTVADPFGDPEHIDSELEAGYLVPAVKVAVFKVAVYKVVDPNPE